MMLRFLLLLFLFIVLLWMLSSRRREVKGTVGTPPQPQAMVACEHCGVHLPRGEAVAGRDSKLYCGAEHRLAHERGATST
jgi:uncharacterized protein